MPRQWFRIATFTLLAFMSMCCQARRARTIETVVYCDNMRPYVEDWKVEASRRFDDAVVVFCHGDDREGVWVATPDHTPAIPVTTFAGMLKSHYPNRPIILVTCNPGGRRINVPDVYYTTESVWLMPDRIAPRMTPDGWQTGCGQVSEFVTGER